MIIQKIFEGANDAEVHDHFVKFSRGEFRDRYLIDAKKQSNKWVIKTGPEFVNNFVYHALKDVSGAIPIQGIVSTTIDLADELTFDIVKVSNFQGVRKYVINTTLQPSAIISLMERYPRAFFALSFRTDAIDLKVKPKPPKSAKPSSKDDEAVKADFCTLKTSDEGFVRDFFFDITTPWKEVHINHTIIVESIVYPDNMDALKPSEVREQSKRQGTIIRMTDVDGVKNTTQATFVA